MKRAEMKAMTPSEMSRLLSEGLLVDYRKVKKMLVTLRNLQKLTNIKDHPKTVVQFQAVYLCVIENTGERKTRQEECLKNEIPVEYFYWASQPF